MFVVYSWPFLCCILIFVFIQSRRRNFQISAGHRACSEIGMARLIRQGGREHMDNHHGPALFIDCDYNYWWECVEWLELTLFIVLIYSLHRLWYNNADNDQRKNRHNSICDNWNAIVSIVFIEHWWRHGQIVQVDLCKGLPVPYMSGSCQTTSVSNTTENTGYGPGLWWRWCKCCPSSGVREIRCRGIETQQQQFFSHCKDDYLSEEEMSTISTSSSSRSPDTKDGNRVETAVSTSLSSSSKKSNDTSTVSVPITTSLMIIIG